MKNFSNIHKTLKTEHNNIINDVVVATGLPKENIQKLYENFSFQTDGDVSKIKSLFSSMIIPTNNDINTDANQIIDYLEKKNYQKILEALITINDTSKLFNIISTILKKLDVNDNFKNIILEISKEFEMSDLLESEKVSYIGNIMDGSEIDNTLSFYNGLKEVLGKNNKRWGNNYHLDNVYQSIWNYLNSEIEYLVNKNNVQITTDTFHEELIQTLFVSNLNPMYKSVDILRTMIPDIQALVFDMIMITTKFVIDNQIALSYLSVDKWNEYLDATYKIYGKISSSRFNSKVLIPKEILNAQKEVDESEGYISPKYPASKPLDSANILFDLPFDYGKFGYFRPLKFSSVIDAIYIVKSCSTEFNIGIRPFLREWVTKAFEILSRGEKIIIELKKINNNKNGW
ncbi:hypothetical protein M0Q97_03260 [Candidatus Dojkabacteria bacterium]|jgi:hypothetical protein|nr:hypothetical protein [Candidatus Dojkabacteria bacterium]